jgi:hypothetical protein
MVLTMDDVQFENWKRMIKETLAATAKLQEQAAERHREWEKRAAAFDRRLDRYERCLDRED